MTEQTPATDNEMPGEFIRVSNAIVSDHDTHFGLTITVEGGTVSFSPKLRQRLKVVAGGTFSGQVYRNKGHLFLSDRSNKDAIFQPPEAA